MEPQSTQDGAPSDQHPAGNRGVAQPPCGADQAPAVPSPAAVVGLALKKDKRKKHISDRLVQMAAEAGITLKFIDKELPLEAQGSFAAILQKVRKPEWEAELDAYAAAHPEVRVFDMPAATYPLRNRGTMVSFLDGDGWVFEEPAALVQGVRPPQRARVNVPTNTTLAEGATYAQAAQQVADAGLHFPLLAKPLWADGREGSHALAVIHTPRGLERLVAGEARHLALPTFLQQYVDHGGCLFKVYVLADTSVRVKRSSLHLPQWCSTLQPTAAAADHLRQHPVYACSTEQLPDLELLERVSAYPASKSWGKADTAPKGHGVPSPPAWLLQALAQRLRARLGLSLFNFDVIVPMHLHRRRTHGDTADAEVPLPDTGSSSGVNEHGPLHQQQQQQQQNDSEGAPSLAPEEPAVLDLQQAEAEARAAAAAASSAAAGQLPSLGLQAAPTAAGSQSLGRPQQQEREEPQELLYHLIDINYFPGYEKMPDYESYMVQFLRSIAVPGGGEAQRGG